MEKKINLNIHKKLGLMSGLPYPVPDGYKDKSKFFRWLWTTYVNLPYFLMVIELMSQAVQITLSIQNIEVLTTCTLSTVYIVQFLLKIIVFKKNEKVFNKIFEEMSAISWSLMDNPFGDERFPEIHNKYYNKVVKISVFKGSMQLASNIGLNVLFCVLSWIGRKPKITAAFSWTPYDSSKNPGYTLTCLFEMICYGSVTARTAVIDLLFWVMIIIPTVQLKYMKHLMEIALKITEDEEELQILNGDEIMDPRHAVPENNLEFRMEWWIKHHQRIMGMVQSFEGLASAFLAVNYMASLIDLFMSGFVAISSFITVTLILTHPAPTVFVNFVFKQHTFLSSLETKPYWTLANMSHHWNIFQGILINAIIITDAFQLYVVSLAGDWLRESSQCVADYGFTELLLRSKKAIRQKYLFILSRTQRIIQIRFGGIYPLSTATFSTLIQLTLTYFVTMLQIKNSRGLE